MLNTKSDKSVGSADWTLIAKLSELNAQRPLLAVTLNERKYVLFQNVTDEEREQPAFISGSKTFLLGLINFAVSAIK